MLTCNGQHARRFPTALRTLHAAGGHPLPPGRKRLATPPVTGGPQDNGALERVDETAVIFVALE